MPRDLVDTAQAGAAVGRSARTVRRWAREGRLCVYGTGRRVLVSLDEVVALASVMGAGDSFDLR